MTKNLRRPEKIVRYSLGTLLTAWGLAGGPTWAYFGVYLLGTASWGFCPLYALMDRG